MANLFEFKSVFTHMPELLSYLPVTLKLTVISFIIAVLLGLLLAVIKLKKIPVLRQISAVFISIMRGTPVLVLLYIVYFGIPMIVKMICIQRGIEYTNNVSGMACAIVALSLNESAYLAEIFRGALTSVNAGQTEAASALGMTYFQSFRRIILPEMFTVALPGLGNSLIGLLKGTSLAFSCAVVEMTAQGKIIGGRTYRYFEVYVSLALIYWGLTIVIEQIIRLIEKKISIPEHVSLADTGKKEVEAS